MNSQKMIFRYRFNNLQQIKRDLLLVPVDVPIRNRLLIDLNLGRDLKQEYNFINSSINREKLSLAYYWYLGWLRDMLLEFDSIINGISGAFYGDQKREILTSDQIVNHILDPIYYDENLKLISSDKNNPFFIQNVPKSSTIRFQTFFGVKITTKNNLNDSFGPYFGLIFGFGIEFEKDSMYCKDPYLTMNFSTFVPSIVLTFGSQNHIFDFRHSIINDRFQYNQVTYGTIISNLSPSFYYVSLYNQIREFYLKLIEYSFEIFIKDFPDESLNLKFPERAVTISRS